MSCPVVQAIKEIRGAGWYAEDRDDVIKLGGNDTVEEFICDDMSFYMMTRKMDLARFELKKPSAEECTRYYVRGYGENVGLSYSELYVKLLDRAFKKKLLYKQFVELVNLIAKMEDLILARVESAGRAGQTINISLPDIMFSPHVDKLIIYRADVLEHTINRIISYVNKLNVNSLLPEPVIINIPHVKGFEAKLDSSIIIKPLVAKTAEEYIAGLKELLAQEMVVAEHLHELEKYHCIVINHVNQVYDVCKKIISMLVK